MNQIFKLACYHLKSMLESYFEAAFVDTASEIKY